MLITTLLKKNVLLKGERNGDIFLEMISGGGTGGTDGSGGLC